MATAPDDGETIDVTADVLALAERLHDLFEGQRLQIVPMAMATVIGTTIEDIEMLNGILETIGQIARQVHTAQHILPEGTMIQ